MGPLHVTAEVFCDLHRDVRITWEARSLWSFSEQPLDALVDQYDLVVVDHPMIGWAAEHGLLIPLDELVVSGWLADQAAGTVGGSHLSYRYAGHQWAATIDAACPVGVSRDDLLLHAGTTSPESWEGVLSLARSSGRVAVPLKQIDALVLFFTLCANYGSPPVDLANATFVSEELGVHVLDQMAELLRVVGRRCLDWSPIDLLTVMSTTDELLYCPHAFGYTNYSREGYAPHRLRFRNFPGPGAPSYAGATLGGAGLAISSRSLHVDVALEYLQWVASPGCQRATYVLAGGQPGHAAAWDDRLANAATGGFFGRTRQTIEHAYVRPNDPAMPGFQALAGAAVRAFLLGHASARDTFRALHEHYRASFGGRP